MGDPRDPETIIGPLIRRSQCDFIRSRIEAAEESGARVMCGGGYTGNFFEPTVLADVRLSSDCIGGARFSLPIRAQLGLCFLRALRSL